MVNHRAIAEASATRESRRTSAAAADPLRGHPRDHWPQADGDADLIIGDLLVINW